MMRQIDEAVKALKQSGIIVMPTEGVYGLSCLPTEAAIQKLLRLKKRPEHKGFILVAANWQQLEPFCAPLTDEIKNRILPTWPGPVTWVLPANKQISPYLTGNRSTIAVRVSDHPLIREVCLACHSALVSTSANLSATEPAKEMQQARATFADQVDYYLEGQLGSLSRPTTIRDGKTGKVLR